MAKSKDDYVFGTCQDCFDTFKKSDYQVCPSCSSTNIKYADLMQDAAFSRKISNIEKTAGLVGIGVGALVLLVFVAGIWLVYNFLFSGSQYRGPDEATRNAQWTECQRMIRDEAANPSTVNFSVLGAAASYNEDTDVRTVRMNFSARNALGGEFEFIGLCRFSGSSTTGSLQIVER